MVKLGKTIPAGDLFELDAASSIPVWLQLKNRFIYLITSGFYLPGDQLPTVRGLAAEVEVNYNTVSKVYQSLEEDGYIVSKRRLGAFVADVSDKPGVSREGREHGGALPLGSRHRAQDVGDGKSSDQHEKRNDPEDVAPSPLLGDVTGDCGADQ